MVPEFSSGFLAGDTADGLGRYVSAPLRLGLPPYPCADPLVGSLAALPGVTIERAAPAVLTQRFWAGDLEGALLPALDCLGQPPCKIVPGIGVSALGPTRTERLLARVEPAALRRVAYDPSMGGMLGLARVVLAECLGVHPEFVPFAGEADGNADFDGLLTAGDEGFVSARLYSLSYDLGTLWHEHTELPFVQLVWAGRRGAPLPEIRRVLALALQGARALLEDADMGAAHEGGAPEDVRHYLTRTVRYDLASMELDSLRQFLRLAAKQGLCAENARLQFC